MHNASFMCMRVSPLETSTSIARLVFGFYFKGFRVHTLIRYNDAIHGQDNRSVGCARHSKTYYHSGYE